MKSMKKMLCLLLVAMLLVAAIPVAAGAQEIPSFEQNPEEPVAQQPDAQQPDAQQPAARTVATLAEPAVLPGVGEREVNYTVLFAVENPNYDKDPKWAFSSAIAVFSVAGDANQDAIRAAAAGAAAKAGYATVTPDAIVSRVSANGGAGLVHNVRYGSIRTEVRTDNTVVYILSVTARPEEVNADETVQAKILLDKENTGKFEDTGKTVPVTLVKTTYGETETYSMKTNGGATVDDIKGVLGANYKNKTLSMTVQGPSADGEVTYRVVVKGSGSTGTNIPTYDGTGSNNNGGNNIGSGSTGSNIPGYNPGSGSSNNGGSGSTGSGSNSGNAGNYDFTTPKTLMICYGDRVFTRKVSSASEFEAAKADAIAEMQRYGYTFKGWK